MSATEVEAVADVAVVIVTADSGPSLKACLQSVMAQPGVAEVVIVDNASSDGMPAAVAAIWADDGRLKLLPQQRNLGFGAGVNLGAGHTLSSRLLILNPDCLLAPDSVPCLQRALDAHPRAGLIGALICDQHGHPDPASRRRDPLLRPALATMLRRGSDRGVAVEGDWPTGVVTCDAVSGALMMLPRHVWQALGGFDEAYFLHCEDLDLCRRVRDLGYAVLLDGGVRVEHGKGGSSRHRPVFVSWHKHRGMWRWFRRHDPDARRPWLAGVVWCGLWLHFAVGAPGRWLAGRKHRRDARRQSG